MHSVAFGAGVGAYTTMPCRFDLNEALIGVTFFMDRAGECSIAASFETDSCDLCVSGLFLARVAAAGGF